MKQNGYLLVGLISLMLSINSLCAQKGSLNVSTNNELYKRVHILDVELGIGFTGIQRNGNGSWYIENNKNDVPFISSIQLITCTPYNNIGCGLFYYDYSNGTKKHDGVLSPGINGKRSFCYIAPQTSLIRRQVGFLDGIMHVSAGIGYVNYRNKGTISQLENYDTTCSTVGGNMGVAHEYAFDSRLGIRLGVGYSYVKIEGLHKNTNIGELSMRPREKFHLVVSSLEIGLSYYIVQW